MPKQYDREQLAWAAGFFDGEGTIVSQYAPSRNSAARNIILSVSQAGEFAEELLQRFDTATGNLGKTYVVHGNRPIHYKKGYAYRTGKFEHVQQIICSLWPFLGPKKRQQAAKALKDYCRYPRLRMTSDRGKAMADARWEDA